METNHSRFIILAILSGLVGGYLIGVIAGISPTLMSEYNVTHTELSAIVGNLLVGVFFASITSWYLVKKLDYIQSILFCCVFSLIVTVAFYFSHSFETLYVARLFQGISVGYIMIFFPLFFSHIEHSRIRRLALLWFHFFILVGVTFSNLMNLMLYGAYWKLPMLVPVVFFAIIYYMIYQMREIRITPVKTEHKRIILMDLLQWKYIKLILLVSGIVVLTQLSGPHIFMEFGVLILKSSGSIDTSQALGGQVVVTTLNIFVSLLAIFLISRMKARSILLIGTLGISLGLMILSASFSYGGYIMTIIGMTVALAFYAFGPNALISLICTELLPKEVRSVGLSVAYSIGALMGALILYVFLPLSHALGYTIVFSILLFFTLIYSVVAYFGVKF